MDISLALSGGGIRGAAHIGAIKALLENDYNITSIAGTSSGAIVASLFAMGYNTNEMIKLFEYFAKDVMGVSPKFIFKRITKEKSFKIKGLCSSEAIEKMIDNIAEIKHLKFIEDINIPIVIPTTDLLNNREVIFSNGKIKEKFCISDIEIGKAVRASSTFPCMYEPYELNECQFVDGGILNNLAIRELKEISPKQKVVGVKFNIKSSKKKNTIYNISMKSLDLMQEKLMENDITPEDDIISIDLEDVDIFSIKKIRYCYEQGYNQTLKQLNKLK